MANRVIRGDILTSDRVNCLSAEAEVFYRRLMSVADDFGRYDGRLSILRSNLYPLRPEKVTDQDINKWIKECVDSGCIFFYKVDNKPYIEIWNFGQTIRIKKAKYPENPNKPQATASHLQTSANNCEQAHNTCVSGVETNPIQSREETRVGVGLQQNAAHTPTPSDSSNKFVWNDLPTAADVTKPPPTDIITAAIRNVELMKCVKITEQQALDYWETWKVQYLHGQKYYKSPHEVYSHYLNCIKNQPFNVKNFTNEQQQKELSPAAQRIAERNKQQGIATATGS